MGVERPIVQDRLKSLFSNYEGRRDELIPILQNVQREFGYLSEEVMSEVAGFVGVTPSLVYAVATFYAQFRFTPLGKKHVTVCRGTACYVRGVARILEEIKKQLGIEEGQTTEDLEYSIETVACIGCCGLSPCIMINNKVEAKMTPKKAAEMFSRDRSKT
jgi:NADH-quinone oxidoreductase subunit E